MSKRFYIIIVPITLALLGAEAIFTLSSPMIAAAQTAAQNNYTVLAPLPCISGNGVSCPSGNLQNVTQVSYQQYIQYAFNLMIALAAVAAVVMLVWGGFEYVLSAVPGTKSDGKARVTNAVIGLVLVLCTYLILKTINPQLVNIPSTLVPPLPSISGDNPVTSSNAFWDTLSQQAAQNNIQTSQFGAAKSQAQSQVNALQQKLSTLQSQLGTLSHDKGLPDNDPQVQSVQAQIADTKNQISSAEANFVLSTWQAAMSAQLNSGNTGQGVDTSQYSTLQDVKNAENNVETSYLNGLTDLNSAGGDVNQNMVALQNTYYQVNGNLILKEGNIVYNTPGAQVTDYQTAISDLQKIDSSYPQDIQNQAKTLLNQLTKKEL
ncbi:MAG: hypothetical protein KGJ33_02395, partial [Patescibacteria group bacterium]|nr:hypothetical protein [Patescibacteria group bacterium]